MKCIRPTDATPCEKSPIPSSAFARENKRRTLTDLINTGECWRQRFAGMLIVPEIAVIRSGCRIWIGAESGWVSLLLQNQEAHFFFLKHADARQLGTAGKSNPQPLNRIMAPQRGGNISYLPYRRQLATDKGAFPAPSSCLLRFQQLKVDPTGPSQHFTF